MIAFPDHSDQWELARLEIDPIMNAVADHLPDITKMGDPERLRSGWLNGVKRFEVDHTRRRPVAHRAGRVEVTAAHAGR